MIKTINEYDFIDAFRKMGRYTEGVQWKDNFSHDGLVALYEYLEMLEDDTGQTIELDVIALCCEYAEYDNLEEFQADYGEDYETVEDIQNATSVIMIDDYVVKELNDTRFIIQQF
tara:strand:+ start:667 stop:1011 length:345 start_codon:yes stop_codon:yes gene_type:complete